MPIFKPFKPKIPLKEIQKMVPNVYAVGVFGSQHYNLDNDKSDVDYVAYVISPGRDFVRGKTATQERYLADGSKLIVREVWAVMMHYLKGNLNAIELVLTTPELYRIAQAMEVATPRINISNVLGCILSKQSKDYHWYRAYLLWKTGRGYFESESEEHLLLSALKQGEQFPELKQEVEAEVLRAREKQPQTLWSMDESIVEVMTQFLEELYGFQPSPYILKTKEKY